MENESAKVFVSKLRERIKVQLNYEHDTEEGVEDELKNMTVYRLLELITYTFGD